MDNKGQDIKITSVKVSAKAPHFNDLVLDKTIFSSIFDKDIRRAFLYKRAERIGKALHLILPAFEDSKALKDRVERIAVALTDASTLPPSEGKEAFSRELLALSSVIAIAKTSGRLSHMNAELLLRETQHFLEEVAAYEEPRMALEELPSLATLSRTVLKTNKEKDNKETIRHETVLDSKTNPLKSIGHNGSSNGKSTERREAILSLLSEKGPVYIKDLSSMIKEVSEKTIQRELQKLVLEGKVKREGERRWTRYSLI